MKIGTVKLRNFKNVPDIDKDLKGSNIILLAENTLGKTNFIRAIQAALAGKLGKDSIKHGENKALVEVNLAEFENETPIDGTNHTFTLKIRKNKQGDEVAELNVTLPSGEEKTGKTVIGKIAGETEMEFDFVQLSKDAKGKKKQLEIVESYMDEEFKEFLRVEKTKYKKYYDERTDNNRNITNLEGFINEAGIKPEDRSKYLTTMDVSVLNGQIEKASEHNAKIDKVTDGVEKRKALIVSAAKEIADLEAKIKEKTLAIESAKTEITDGEEWLKKNEIVSVALLNDQVSAANEHNRMVSKVSDYAKKIEELGKMKEKTESLTILYETIKQSVDDAIRDMVFPVAGITFDEDNVYYYGKVIDENSLSTAEQMKLNLELMMAKNPNAQVVFIQRGESLGAQFLHDLQEASKEKGFQIVMENVQRGVQELKIEIMPNY